MSEVASTPNEGSRLEDAMAERLGVPAMPKEPWSRKAEAVGFAMGCALVGALSASAWITSLQGRALCGVALVGVRFLAMMGALESRSFAVFAVPFSLFVDAFIFVCVYGLVRDVPSTCVLVCASVEVAVVATVVFVDAVRRSPDGDRLPSLCFGAPLLAVTIGIALRPYAQHRFDRDALGPPLALPNDAAALVVAGLLLVWATVTNLRRHRALRLVDQWSARVLAGDEPALAPTTAEVIQRGAVDEVSTVSLPDGRGTVWFTGARPRADGGYRTETTVREVAIVRDGREQRRRTEASILSGTVAIALGLSCAFSFQFHRATLCAAYELNGRETRYDMLACIDTGHETIALLYSPTQRTVAGRVLAADGPEIRQYVSPAGLFTRLGIDARASDKQIVNAAKSIGLVDALSRRDDLNVISVRVEHAADGEPLLVVDLENRDRLDPDFRYTFGLRTGSYAFTNF